MASGLLIGQLQVVADSQTVHVPQSLLSEKLYNLNCRPTLNRSSLRAQNSVRF